MAGPSLMDTIFQRSLDDLIKGIRLFSGGCGESGFINKSVDEIRREIKSTDLQTKATALQKLTYLHSLHGVDMSWAAFHAIELSSSQSFMYKRIAYLAATLSFDPSTTDVILLLTHQLRKDLSSSNHQEVSLALHALSSISTVDLARDLTPELFSLLNSNKNIIRKKCIATVLKIFDLYPDSVRVCFKRLVENLECSDPGVVSAVVGVFCELATKDPRSYLPLAPEFYKILVDSRNNWVLIKVLKIFAKLAPLEPRLAKRLVDPICEHLRRTGAKSLAFECIRTIMSSLSEYETAVKLAIEKLAEFMADDDPNLKYLGLQALTTAVPKHSWAVLENKEFVIKSLNDVDVNIKLEALRLVMAMVSEDNVPEICRVLINYALKSDPEFCNEILGSILSTCSKNVYEIIIDFDWYVSLLGEMARLPHCQKGEEIENQLVDISIRVRDARPQLVRVGRDLLIDPALLGNQYIHCILSAAAWVSGEFVQFSKNPHELIEALLQPRTSLLPPSIRAVFIQSALKVLTFCIGHYLFSGQPVSSGVTHLIPFETTDSNIPISNTSPTGIETDEGISPCALYWPAVDGDVSRESIINLFNLVEAGLHPLLGSHEVDVQERVRNVIGFVELLRDEFPGFFAQREGENGIGGELKAHEIIKLMRGAFLEELVPISLISQERVPLPDGLVLNENLRDLEAICGGDIVLPTSGLFSFGRPHHVEKNDIHGFSQENEESEPMIESTSLLAEHRKRHGLYYLPSDTMKDTLPDDDYPPANDPIIGGDTDKTADLIKLTEQSFMPKRKPNQTKPRPVVVRLDDVDGTNIVPKKLESKNDLISGAVRDVLKGDDDSLASTSRGMKPEKLLSRKRREKQSNIDNTSGRTDDWMTAKSTENEDSVKSKHHGHGKEKKTKNPGKNKSRLRPNIATSIEAQSPVIPDYLL
ncbi:unnamed protein product [Cuscuta epithymum]|uniref:AP-3 complex subunit delta n=1 Tax=Cuscuta epithymum TaxID=186058 RepID=A0AAV0G613_9ASTE|nr:unnamed protein product [Cuscuta epithymum]